MSDYARANSGGNSHFGDKDALTTGDADKVIVGSQFDTEFNAIVTAVATKYDSGDLASQAQAEAETVNTTLITPLRLSQWSDANGGMVGDIHALADPGVDTLLGWDDSAGAVIGYTFGDGLEFSGTTVRLEHLGIGDLEDAGADAILFWDDSASATAWLSVGTGLSIATTTLSLSHLGIESLTDPNADSVLFWDDSAGATAWLTFNEGIEFSGTSTVGLSDATPSTTLAIDITSGVVNIDISSLTSLTAPNIVGADLLLIDDGAGGTNKSIAYQDFGIPTTSDATTSIAPTISDANRMYITTSASAVSFVIPANASVAYEVGTTFIIYQSGAGQVTVSVTSDTLRSPNGALTNAQYSVITVTKVAATEWVVYGDTTS